MATKPPAKSGPSTFVLLLSVIVVVFLMLQPDVRTATGNALGVVLDPLFGRAGPVPLVWTLFVMGSIMVLANTVVRHFFTDWVQMARVQEVMRTFQKEFSEARKANNTYKIKRLTEMNPELMKMQADMSTQQMKPMVFTMLIVLPIFAWMFNVMDPHPGWTHIDCNAMMPPEGCCDTYLRVPWAEAGTWCADAGTDWVPFIPRWIAIYSLFSIPVGSAVQRALKLWEYRHADLDADGVPAGKHA